MTGDSASASGKLGHDPHSGFTNAVVRTFLNSSLPVILLVLAGAVGAVALWVTPREEDPQIVVPMADIYVSFPGHNARQVEQLVATPLEKLLYQIDGVEYVYSMSKPDQAIITVRYYVGQDRERSLVKLYKKIDESLDLVPPGVAGWVIKPVEIDDVPIVTLALRGRGAAPADPFVLRRVGEEIVDRLAAVKDISRSYVVGGQPRRVMVYLDDNLMRAHNVSPLEIQRQLAAANMTVQAGDFVRQDSVLAVEAGGALVWPSELGDLVVGLWAGNPVYLKEVARVSDGPAEVADYVRHGFGPGNGFSEKAGLPGTLVGQELPDGQDMVTREMKQRDHATPNEQTSVPAVVISLAKKKGTNAVVVADEILRQAQKLRATVLPDNVEMVVTRNAGINANDKVNDLVEALGVALVFAVAVLIFSLGWREALIVALAVPVVFGLTLAVNLLAGLTINRVTLFALILALGLLVDDPIVDVENIARHFSLRRRASRAIVLEAVSEIRPPLITATIAVIVSFLPLFFITGMMGPYMRPMALNVPVAMFMSMMVAFTITPFLAYHLMRRRYLAPQKQLLANAQANRSDLDQAAADPHALGDIEHTPLYRAFRPLMQPLLNHRWAAGIFLGVMGLLMLLAVALAATRQVPLKMLPYGNKNDLQLVLDFDHGTSLERTDAGVRDLEKYLAAVPEVTDFTSYVGTPAPMDFNGMVRHYYLRRADNLATLQVNLVEGKDRSLQAHALALRVRDELTAIARRNGARLKIVESPPGPPVYSTIVAEVYGQPENSYADLADAARTVAARLAREPGVVDVDDTVEASQTKLLFLTDKAKAAEDGVSMEEIARTLQMALGGATAGSLNVPRERNPLLIQLRLSEDLRSSELRLARLGVKSESGQLVSLAELGRWEHSEVDQTIYHKNLRPVVYVFGEVAGRTPAEVVVDIQADLSPAMPASAQPVGSGYVSGRTPRPVAGRTFLHNGGGLAWWLPEGIEASFRGEGEWNLTIDVFRDMGLAFAAALVAIYILLVWQTGSFVIPVVVMLAIPLTIIGIMPGFWLLSKLTGGAVGPYANPVYFTATAMIGMIALAGIVTRSSIILVDFIHLSLGRGSTLSQAILQSCVVRLRPILLTAGVAMLSAVPIATDPIFSGLAWALIFGLLASTVFTLFVIPVVYYLVYASKPGHGARATVED